MSLPENLLQAGSVVVQQKRELAELIGFETRNKYEIRSDSGASLAFCAEQQKGLVGVLMRQFLGHWRTFEIHFFEPTDRTIAMRALHPFRWFFQALEISGAQGQSLGRLEQRFGFFTKKFDLHDATGRVKFEVRSGFFSFWTFPVTDSMGQTVAVIRKKWSGALKEIFTDSDNFQLEFCSKSLTKEDRLLLLSSAIFVDLQYFERKGSGGVLGILDG